MVAAWRATISGGLASNTERWSTGFWFGAELPLTPPSPAEVQEWATALATNLPTAVSGSLRNALGTPGTIDTVNTYFYADLTGPATLSGAAPLTLAGLGTPATPLPTSVVGSLRTGRAGRRYRGRAYWPAVALAVLPSGRFDSTVATALPARFVALAKAIEVAYPGAADIRLSVASKVAGEVTPVTSISVGDVPDTQRRRRDGLIEAYTTIAY